MPFSKSEKFLNALFKEYDGFKILYNQLQHNDPLWNYFKKTKTIHVIRKNIVETTISFLLCTKSNIWQSRAGDQELNESFYIDPSALEVEIKKVEELINLYSNTITFDLTVYYEELINNWDETIEKVCEILEIEKMKLPKITLKRTQPLKLVLQNFDEHKLYFKNTPYTHFYD